MEQEEKISGEYIQEIFFAEKSHFAIVRIALLEPFDAFEVGDFVVVTGTFPHLVLHHQYEFTGRMVEHATYGRQFQAVGVVELLPKEKEHVLRYLKHLKIKGIGTRTAEALYAFFGVDMLQIIASGTLAVFDGFVAPRWTTEKAQTLQETIQEQQLHQTYFFELIKMGFPTQMIGQLQERYGDDLKKIIEANAYRVLDDFDGISLKYLDGFVQQFFPEQRQYRAVYALIYHIKQYCYRTGSSAITKTDLLEELATDPLMAVSSFSMTQFDRLLDELVEQKKLFFYQGYYALDFFYYTEQTISSRIRELLEAEASFAPHVSSLDMYLVQCETTFGITYGSEQRAAIKQAFEHPVFLMTGGPGTGKTTIIRAILEIYFLLAEAQGATEEQLAERIALLAPTGRAAQRLQETTKRQAKTIHRFLGWDLQTNTYHFNEENPLKMIEFVILDETSMLDMWLFAALLKALPYVKQIIFVGDAHQLPSVASGQCFRDMLRVATIPQIRLQEIFRQKTNSTIIDISNYMNEGKQTDLYFTQSDDYSFLEMQPQHLLSALRKISQNALDKGYDMYEIQILAPLYKGTIGIHAINRHLQRVFNPDVYQEDERFVLNDTTVFLPHDKVIQLKNIPDYDVYNGDIGEIVSIERRAANEYEIVVSFNETLLIYTKEEMRFLRHAYCISIHKAQGSEFQLTIMPLFMQYSIMLYRQLLYTGATRAKKSLIMLGQKQALLQAVANNRENDRKTLLSFLLNADEHIVPQTILEALEQQVIGEDLAGVSPWDFLK